MIYIYFLTFWFILQIFNLIGLPVAFTLFKNLPDRGYAFARPLGLLLTGYLLWLAGSFGLLRNNLGGTIIAMAVVGGAGVFWLRWREAGNPLRWLRDNLSYVLIVEVLFALALIVWTIFKSYNPNIETAGGEKWMEIAFVNSSLLSPHFPPTDPWLSGFGISYYYFGYILMAILTRLSGITPTTAFNLFIPTILALTLTGAFGVAANMAAAFHIRRGGDGIHSGAVQLTGLLGAFFVALTGHWEGVLEVLHSRGLLPPGFWTWLDIRDLKVPPSGAGPWIPERFIWWWRASRVVLDYNLVGNEQEMIDEFPFFSFMLGDVHPHVLALPFVLLAIGLALNLLLAGRQGREAVSSPEGETRGQGDKERGRQGDSAVGLPLTPSDKATASRPSPPVFLRGVTDLAAGAGGWTAFVLYAVCIGALGFLNTWDLPIYLAVLGLTYYAWRGEARLGETVVGLVVFAVAAIALYFPFYLSFQSQAGGILPNLWNPTRLPQFVVFFGPFLIISIVYLFVLSKQSNSEELRGTQEDVENAVPTSSRSSPESPSAVGGQQSMVGGRRSAVSPSWLDHLWWTLPLAILGPVALLILLGVSFLILPSGRDFVQGILNDPAVQAALNGATQSELAREILRRRVFNPWTFIFVGTLVGWTLAHFWSRTRQSDGEPASEGDPAVKLSLILLLVGFLLPLSVEFVFLRDLFGTRMNTIFKFYYQAWILLALASSFGVYYVIHHLSGVKRVIWQGVAALLVLAGLVYPTLAVLNKTNNFQGDSTLDGIAWVADTYPDDYTAILWLRENTPPEAVVLEQPGDSYRYQSRVSALTGRPTLLGWGFHEFQWRGDRDENIVRRSDIDTIYNTLDPAETLTLLDKYDINYVYVGSLERAAYNPNGLAKFDRLLNVAFAQGDVIIYQR